MAGYRRRTFRDHGSERHRPSMTNTPPWHLPFAGFPLNSRERAVSEFSRFSGFVPVVPSASIAGDDPDGTKRAGTHWRSVGSRTSATAVRTRQISSDPGNTAAGYRRRISREHGPERHPPSVPNTPRWDLPFAASPLNSRGRSASFAFSWRWRRRMATLFWSQPQSSPPWRPLCWGWLSGHSFD